MTGVHWPEAANGAADAVSVVIPAYNAAPWIAEAIQSALDQTLRPHEIVVVDDGSADNTSEIAGRFPAPVRVLRKANGGPAAARNFGIAAARGAWIGLLDADDLWAPDKLEKQLALATADVALVCTAVIGEEPAEEPLDTIGFADLWRANLIANSSVLVRREAVVALGGFDEDPKLKSVEDYHLWLRLAASGARIVWCGEPLTYYRRGVGLSSNSRKFLAASLYNIEKVGRQLALPPAMIRSRRQTIRDQFGLLFLHERQMGAARATLRQALAGEPSLSRAFNLGVSYLPRWLLDLRRGVLHRNGRQRAAPARPAFAFRPEAPSLIPASDRPYLLAIIDTEEEFDWKLPPPSSAHVKNLRDQTPAQRIFERFGVVPTYAIDYPVASQPDGFGPLLEFAQDGACEIGAHLHPWVNPPIEEALTERNSFPGNLPPDLERAKLTCLSETIAARFGRRPILYRAGRYGLGPHTFETLAELGFRIDSSVLPYVDLSAQGGPDFMQCSNRLSWVGPQRRLLEVPVTMGVIGHFANGDHNRYRRVFSPAAGRIHLPGVLAHLRLLDRIPLTPEGTSLGEAMRLTEALMRRGQRVFVLSYHSSSLKIGGTSYVRTAAQLAQFISWIEGFLDFFFGKCGGRAATPGLILDKARAAAPETSICAMQDGLPGRVQ